MFELSPEFGCFIPAFEICLNLYSINKTACFTINFIPAHNWSTKFTSVDCS